MQKTHSIPVIVLVLLVLIACRKQLPAANAPGTLGQITYMNVSEDLKAQLSQITPAAEHPRVLIDNSDTAVVYVTDDDTVPYFTKFRPLQFPIADPYNVASGEPWIYYSLMEQGTHQLTLTDSGRHPVLQLSAAVSRDIPLSAWFMDSLGKYQGVAAQDIFNKRNDAAGLRVLDAAPDAGPVFFTINKEASNANGFPDTLKYGVISGFIQRPVALQDTLRLRFYSTSDSVNVLTKQSLVIQPGHAYTFVLAGYNHQHSYQNPHTGKRMTINLDLQVLLFKNN